MDEKIDTGRSLPLEDPPWINYYRSLIKTEPIETFNYFKQCHELDLSEIEARVIAKFVDDGYVVESYAYTLWL
jgi:hypothetical protein